MSRERYVVLPDTQSPEFNIRVKEAVEVLMGTRRQSSSAAAGRRAPTINELNEYALLGDVSGYVTFENLSANGDVGTGADQVAVGARGVTNGDSHDHVGGDGTQIDHGGTGGLSDDDHTQYYNASRHTKGVHDLLGIDHGSLGGLSDDDHTQYIKHVLATAANDFLVASGSGAFVKKTLAETKVILGLPNFIDRGDPAAWDFELAALTTDGAWHDLDLSSIVPAGAVSVLLFTQVKDDATNSYLMFRKNGNSNEYNVSATRTLEVDVYIGQQHTVFLDSNRVIEYKATNTTFTNMNIVVCGWVI